MSTQILLIDDDDDYRHALTQSLQLEGFAVEEFSQATTGIARLQRNDNYIVVSDINMPEMNGMQFLAEIMKIDTSIPVILITGHGNISDAVNAMRAGAYDFIEKPFAIEKLSSIINRASEKRHLVIENRQLKDQLDSYDSLESKLIGNSPALMAIRSKIKNLASAKVDVLLLGETGTGKEVIARALHEEGDRAEHPFMALNCGAIPKEMMVSELFGHEAGAFTSANKKRTGKLEFANGGTVFLDEIESMPLELQVKFCLLYTSPSPRDS